MGCFHTLQPEKDPYLAPSIPTLTIQGFIRFQTIQLLLEPDLHASFLQNAVKRLDLINPADGLPFPNRLPRNALPSRPDPEVVSWHGGVAENLRIESDFAETGGPRTQALAQLSDTAPDDPIASFNDREAVTDMNYCSTPPRPRPAFRPPPSIKVPRTTDAKRTFTFTTLEKRTLYLPNGWHFTRKAPLCLLGPINAFMATISTLWTAAISRARQVPVPTDDAAMFQLGSLVLTFHGSLEDRKPL
ncbi:MAG: hypothetical protein Q9198_005044, partial [Flavoplaca austrocitrina]